MPRRDVYVISNEHSGGLIFEGLTLLELCFQVEGMNAKIVVITASCCMYVVAHDRHHTVPCITCNIVHYNQTLVNLILVN